MPALHNDPRNTFARVARWMLSGEDSSFLARACLVASLAIGAWLAMQAWPAGLVRLDQRQPVPLPYVLDFNSAAWPELAQLPGIGETLAKRIVASRVSEGPFVSVDDLQRVSGIGPKTIDRIARFFPTDLPHDSGEVAKK